LRILELYKLVFKPFCGVVPQLTDYMATVIPNTMVDSAADWAPNSPPSVTVVICCHNSATRLPDTLRHLAEQRVGAELVWDVLVVDNASTDETAVFTERFASAHPHVRIRVTRESRAGLIYARLRGIEEASGEVLLFADDDNWLAPDYVTILSETMSQHPEISALGGMSMAVCEQDPPEWLSRHQRWYAVSGPPEEGEMLREVEFLWGAGTAFRRQALERVIKYSFRLTGRQGTSLQSGEDVELCNVLRLNGERLYLHPALWFQHYLPAHRVNWDYLRRLHYAAGEASVLLDAYRLNDPGMRSPWPAWLLRSWPAQMCNAYWQIVRDPVLLWSSTRNLLEGDDRVLRLETYRGRLAALKQHRTNYRQMLSAAAVQLLNKPQMSGDALRGDNSEA
jgi:glycosyltransferase involved in cell wall biosynthesis